MDNISQSDGAVGLNNKSNFYIGHSTKCQFFKRNIWFLVCRNKQEILKMLKVWKDIKVTQLYIIRKENSVKNIFEVLTILDRIDDSQWRMWCDGCGIFLKYIWFSVFAFMDRE